MLRLQFISINLQVIIKLLSIFWCWEKSEKKSEKSEKEFQEFV